MAAMDEYRAVLAKVDAFAAQVAARAGAAMACRAGCAGCCQAGLTVSPVEAAAIAAHLERLPPQARNAIAARAERHREGCVFLDEGGRCSVYEARPIVCRTQGLPLRYPPGFVPAEAVGIDLGERGAVTWCPLNFAEAPPGPGEVLDAELVDRLLAVVNRRHCAGTGEEPLERIALDAIAAGRR